ncbi:MAG: hypothetical protein CSA51_03335 [Gammaproteobacteria bacterium]|nr:MAG: hypothetical protein CSA51_03335 [Gammaproteobacteria bacterium]
MSLTALALLLLALLTPWVLGYALLKPFLKQRYGYHALALGGGYLLGWLLLAVVLYGYHLWQRPFAVLEILIAAWCAILPLLWLKAKPCTIEELRLEKAPGNMAYLLSLLLLLLLLYRWGLTLLDLWFKPLLPTDAGLAVSTLAKHFYLQGTMPLHITMQTSAVEPSSLLALIQTYAALAWGRWDESVIHLPWLGVSIAMVFTVFGGLRYLGAKLLPAMLCACAAVSFPLSDASGNLGGSTQVWIALALLVAVMLWVIALTYHEWRLLLPLVVVMLVLCLSKSAILIAAGVLLLVLLWRLAGGFLTTVLLVLLIFIGVVNGDYLSALLQSLLGAVPPGEVLLLNADTRFGDYPIVGWLWQQTINTDNWHCLITAGAGSLLLLLLSTQRTQARGMTLLIVAAVAALLMLLLINVFSTATAVALATHANHLMLMIAPLVVLIALCVYHVLSKDDETLPLI